MKIVEIGGAKYLLNMLESAKDDRTRKEALKALVALSHSGWFVIPYGNVYCNYLSKNCLIIFTIVLNVLIYSFILPLITFQCWNAEQVAGVLHQSGVLPIIISTPNSLEYIDIENYKSKLMKRYEDLKYDTSI